MRQLYAMRKNYLIKNKKPDITARLFKKRIQNKVVVTYSFILA